MGSTIYTICDTPMATINGQTTCSNPCHELLVAFIEATYGRYKKIGRASTGQFFRVPTRDLIEKGIKESELDQYPPWDEIP